MKKLAFVAALSLTAVAAWAQGGRYGSPPTPGTDTGRRAEPSVQAASGASGESAKKDKSEAHGKVDRSMGRAGGQGASAAATHSHPASAPKSQP